MIPTLSEQQRHAIQQHGGIPVYVMDEQTNTSYVLVRADDFEKMKNVLGGNDVDAMYPLIADVSPEDWEDASNYEIRQ